ncbi:MAG: YbaY family lipoprotein [Fimbriimonadia bacterium]|nr:YbaY family lipoprotein [Fimbriimonadia bacterium]
MRRSCFLFLFFAVVHVSFAQGSVQWKSSEQSRADWWKAKATYPVWNKPAGAQVLASEHFKSDALGRYNRFLSETRELMRDLGKPHGEHFVEIKSTLSVNTPQVVSGYLTHFEYTGGAHPNTFYQTINVGIVNGKPARLNLKSLLAQGVSPQQVLNEVALPKLNTAKEKRGLEAVDRIDPKLADSFIITPQGISWIFQPYAVGAYVEGTYIIKATWNDLSGLLNPNGPAMSLMTNLSQGGVPMLTLTGEVFYLERIALPPNAKLLIQVVDASRADAPAITIVEKTLSAKSGKTPFELKVDARKLEARYRYLFQARITVDGQLWFINDTAFPVPVEGWSEPQQIRVVRANSRE